jgi:hypothetical protein
METPGQGRENPRPAVGSKVDFLPGLSVDPTTTRPTAHLALTYYYPDTVLDGQHLRRLDRVPRRPAVPEQHARSVAGRLPAAPAATKGPYPQACQAGLSPVTAAVRGGLRVEEIAGLAWCDLQERGDAGQVTVYATDLRPAPPPTGLMTAAVRTARLGIAGVNTRPLHAATLRIAGASAAAPSISDSERSLTLSSSRRTSPASSATCWAALM